jgi:hypothetical protein
MSAFTRPGSRHVHTKLSHKEYIDPFAVPYTGTNAATKTHSRKFTAKAPRDVHGQLSQNDDENAAAATATPHQAAQRGGARISLAGRRHYRESINVDASRFIPFSRQQLSPPAHHAHCPPPPQEPAASLLLASSACT